MSETPCSSARCMGWGPTALQKSNFAFDKSELGVPKFGTDYHQFSLHLITFFLQKTCWKQHPNNSPPRASCWQKKPLPIHLPRYCVIVSIEWRIPADLHMEYPGWRGNQPCGRIHPPAREQTEKQLVPKVLGGSFREWDPALGNRDPCSTKLLYYL